MVDISVKNLIKAFEEGNNILDGLSFEINAGERVGLLGRNGAGKTTLFRLLVGEYSEDEGDIVIAPGKRIGLISQIPVYPAHYTTEDVLKTAHERLFAMARRMEELAERMARDHSREVLAEYDRLGAAFEAGGGYNTDFERDRVANGLDIPAAMRGQLFSSLSGGEKTRVNLARLILENTDILLLDEPTNHLDLKATEWLEEYLLKFKGTVLAISHDRYFLDTVAQRTIELVDGKAEFYSGNYSFYLLEKQRRFDEQMRQYEKNQAKIAQLQKAADQMHRWAFMGNDKLHKRAFSMEKRIERLETAVKPQTEKKMKTRFGEKEFRGDELLVIKGLSKSFGERKLFDVPELNVTGGERIALIGDNGTGKSTFIKLLMGEMSPDTGWVRHGPAVKSAYLPQIIKFDDPYRTVLDTVIYDSNCSPQSARNQLGAFKFSGEDVFKPVYALSGGEQSRLRLCMLMKEDINFLILDEPTNHLDISSREWIEQALSEYSEALLFVSHDRYFIDMFATRVWALENGSITDFRGGFTEFKAWQQRRAATEQAMKAEKRKKEPRQKPVNTERLLARTERDIAALEAKIAELDALEAENSSNYQKLLELSEQRVVLQTELDRLYEKWEELAQ